MPLHFNAALQVIMAGRHADNYTRRRWESFLQHDNPFVPYPSKGFHPPDHLLDGMQVLGILGNKLHHWSGSLQRYADKFGLVTSKATDER